MDANQRAALRAHVATHQVDDGAALSIESLFPLSIEYNQPGFCLPRRACCPPTHASVSMLVASSTATMLVQSHHAARPSPSLERPNITCASDSFRESRPPSAVCVAGEVSATACAATALSSSSVPLVSSRPAVLPSSSPPPPPPPPPPLLPTTGVDDDSASARTVDEIFQSDPNARRYRVIRSVGTGAYGGVWHCEDTSENHRPVAVKILKAVANPGNVPRELAVLRGLCDSKDPTVARSVVRLLNDFVLHRQHQCFAFDLAQETLAQTIVRHLGSGMPHSKIRVVVGCVLRGLGAFRRMKPALIHGDLKPENVLRFGADYKISDLGNSCRSDRPYTHLFQSEGYRAPEVYLIAPNYGPEMDMWSLGCMMLEMASGNGQSPFRTKDTREYFYRLRDALGTPSSAFLERSARVDEHYPPDSATPIGYDEKRAGALTVDSLWGRDRDPAECSQMLFVNLVQRMLEYDPYDRITPDRALAHDYFYLFQ